MLTKKSLKIKNRIFRYDLKKRKGARSMRLAIYPDGAFVVTAPRWYPLYAINKFIENKAEWIYEKLKHVDFEVLSLKREKEREHYKANKKTAKTVIEERLNFLNQHYQFPYNRISVKNQKSCWGSASRKGNLNFNYKIAYLPDRLRDYVIVHELCHLQELNHSRRFWELVRVKIPEYKLIRRRLKNIKI